MNLIPMSSLRKLRRCLIPSVILGLAFALNSMVAAPPNIILIMSDDQGWGDVGYNENPIVKTPQLDAMARAGVRLDRFYSSAPVCSPTRASALTGRHSSRFGIQWVNDGRLKPEEATLAEALHEVGYRSGHFGKWHVGTMTETGEDGYRGGEGNQYYSPPWENGFDVCFSNEIGGPTYNPMVWGNGEYGGPDYGYFMQRPVAKGETTLTPGVTAWPAHFWTGPGETVGADELAGDTSRIIMDHALDFIDTEAKEKTPFLAVVWFFAPHTPIAAGDEDREPYLDLSMEEQHWYGCLTAMDQQVGRLRARLRELEIADDTLVWFCSDNGPSWVHDYNSAGPFRGKKGTLYEGGLRVPAVVEWPAGLPTASEVDVPISTSDFYPTLLKIAGAKPAKQPMPIDGIDVLPILRGEVAGRPSPIAFQSPRRTGAGWEMDTETRQQALIGNQYKLISVDEGKTYSLYDLLADPAEMIDVANRQPVITGQMKAYLEQWIDSCALSLTGHDYR